jgi:hypothetical protein
MSDTNANVIDDGDHKQPADGREKRRAWLYEPICTLQDLLGRPVVESPLGQHLRDLDQSERQD